MILSNERPPNRFARGQSNDQPRAAGRSNLREHVRAQIAGIRIVYSTNEGETADTDAFDIGQGGLFIETPSPLDIGKRIDFEIAIGGVDERVAAVGRVVWARTPSEAFAPERPAGMGLKFIDLDETASEMIGRLVATRRPTLPGIDDFARLPSISPDPPASGEAREPRASRELRDATIPFDLVNRKPAPRQRSRKGAVVVVGALALAAGVAVAARGPLSAAALPKLRAWVAATFSAGR